MLDISNVCRICLKEEDPKLPIFTESDEKSESKPTLPEKIMSFARVKVVKDDGLPMYICVKCYCQVDTTVEFKRLCEESFHFFTRQLDAFPNQLQNQRSLSPYGNAGASNMKDNCNGYDSNYRILNSTNNDAHCQPSLKDAVSFSQHWIIPEETIKGEEFEHEFSTEEESMTQVFKITSNDVSWIVNGEKLTCETEIDPMTIKCESNWDYPNFELDVPSLEIENCSENVFDEERVNPLEISTEHVPRSSRSKSLSGSEKMRKCHSCEMVFSNRRDMSFHISVAHRRCSECGKYFFSNKDKNTHRCDAMINVKPKFFVPKSVEKIAECCRLCNKSVKQMKSHMAWHRKKKLKLKEIPNEQDSDKSVNSISQIVTFKAFHFKADNNSDDKIKCHLCDTICSNQKGFKIHMTCMHRDHRIVYACFECKSRQFLSKASCKKHMVKEHGVLENGNIRYELINANDCEKDGVRLLEKKGMIKKKNFNNVRADGNIKKLNINLDCHNHLSQNNYVKSKVTAQANDKEKRFEINHRKSGIRTSHPPFSTEIPIISNNFEVTHDSNGNKRYVCRGCNSNYKHYTSAYMHYYVTNKRAARTKQNQLVIEGKPFNCKFCTLKFASRSQVVMHRINAHKCYYNKFTLGKKKSKPHNDYPTSSGKYEW